MLIDLGSGGNKTKAPGHIGIDIAKLEGVDIVWDLNKGLPKDAGAPRFRQNTIDGIRCHQVIEHLDTIIPLMNDCYEVLKPGAIFELSTPDGMSRQLWQDPTHKRGYVWETFIYFSDSDQYADAQEEYGITARFKYLDHWIENEWNLQIRLTK